MSTELWAVYILTTRRNTVLYTGVTSNLVARVWQHRSGVAKGAFTSRYSVNKLVYFEVTPNIAAAIAREKQIKSWKRSGKVRLIEATNPDWRDLAGDLNDPS